MVSAVKIISSNKTTARFLLADHKLENSSANHLRANILGLDCALLLRVYCDGGLNRGTPERQGEVPARPLVVPQHQTYNFAERLERGHMTMGIRPYAHCQWAGAIPTHACK